MLKGDQSENGIMILKEVIWRDLLLKSMMDTAVKIAYHGYTVPYTSQHAKVMMSTNFETVDQAVRRVEKNVKQIISSWESLAKNRIRNRM